MPIGPNGEKRPVSVVQNAHHVFQVLTGQAEEEYVEGSPGWLAQQWAREAEAAPDQIAVLQAAETESKKKSKSRTR